MTHSSLAATAKAKPKGEVLFQLLSNVEYAPFLRPYAYFVSLRPYCLLGDKRLV
jgi:hypothetical protein